MVSKLLSNMPWPLNNSITEYYLAAQNILTIEIASCSSYVTWYLVFRCILFLLNRIWYQCLVAQILVEVIELHRVYVTHKIYINYCPVCSQPDEAKPSNGSWIPPPCWTGPSPILYQSFDSSDGFVLKEGTQNPSVPVPLVSGKVR